MMSINYMSGVHAADFLSVRSPRYFSAAIRRHESRANPGKCYTNHNAPVVDDAGELNVIQIAPPIVRKYTLNDYFDLLDAERCQWIVWRAAWAENDRINRAFHSPAFLSAWQHACSKAALELVGLPYSKRDLARLVLSDLSFGLLRPKNLKPPYCTDGVVHMLRAGQPYHAVPSPMDKRFPSPWDVEQAARQSLIIPVCFNSQTLLRCIMEG